MTRLGNGTWVGVLVVTRDGSTTVERIGVMVKADGITLNAQIWEEMTKALVPPGAFHLSLTVPDAGIRAIVAKNGQEETISPGGSQYRALVLTP